MLDPDVVRGGSEPEDPEPLLPESGPLVVGGFQDLEVA
jgi:hypothetical protein